MHLALPLTQSFNLTLHELPIIPLRIEFLPCKTIIKCCLQQRVVVKIKSDNKKLFIRMPDAE